MERINSLAIYCEKSHIFLAFYLPLFIEKSNGFASVLILLDLSKDVLGDLCVFPDKCVGVEAVKVKAILVNKH